MHTPQADGQGLFPFGQIVPPLPDPVIERDNILDTIDQIFASGHDLMVLEGPEGTGKTVVSSMFARRHHDSVFTLFLRAGSRWGYEPDLHREELFHQMATAVRKVVRGENPPTEAAYRSLILALRRWLRGPQGRAYFVVDGLTELPKSASHGARELWDLLPLDVPGLKFLVTKDSESPIDLPFPKTAKTMFLPVLSLGESIQVLRAIGVTSPDDEQLHRTCMGRPDRLAAVRRLVISGVAPHDLVREIDTKAPHLFDIEWNQAAISDAVSELALGILAFGDSDYSLEDLSRLTRVPALDLRDRLGALTYLECAADGGRVKFVSDPFRRYASSRLSHTRKKVDDAVIGDLLARSQDRDVANRLPGALHQAGRYEQLLQYLTPDHLEAAVRLSQSATPIKRHIDFGVQAALELSRDGELVRFSIHKSTLSQLESVGVWKAEVEARIALDDFPTAQALANAVGLKEDRLHLLAVLAKGKVKLGSPPAPELLDTIRSLYAQIDHGHLGERALEIAADLIYSLPGLAIEMVEQASKAEPEFADAAIATLALAAPKDVLPTDEIDPVKEMRDRVRSPYLRQFIEEAKVRTRDTSASDILTQIQQVNLVHRKLFFLRQWAVQNPHREDAWQVVGAGLDLAVAATEYTPNARDMRELASPLPFLDSAERMNQLAGRFAANRGNIERYGPKVDYVRLLLLLARGEYRHDKVRGGQAFCDAYVSTADITDVGVRAECFARLIKALEDADPDRQLDATDDLHNLAEKGLMEAIGVLKDTTALHDTVFAGIIKAIARNRVDLAATVALSLNTEPRRDESLVEVITAGFDRGRPAVGFGKVRELIEKVCSPECRADALDKVLEQARRKKVVPAAWGTDVRQLLGL